MKKALIKFIKVLAFILAIIVVWYIGSTVFYKLTYQGTNINENQEQIDDGSFGEDNKIKPAVKNELLFLLAGTDQNDGSSAGNTRTDTLMLFKVNFKDGTIDQMSIPRDTRVPVNGSLDKINHASAYGGIRLTMQTIRDWLDIDLDYYVKINFESVVSLVDAIGGVRIEVPKVIANGTSLSPGMQRLNGKQALEFVRFRKGYATGDYGRVEAQQVFISALVNELFQARNMLQFPTYINIFDNEVDTNISKSFLLSKALNARNFGADKMTKHIVPGEGAYINGISYFVYYKDDMIQLRNELYNEYRLNAVNYLENQ